MFQEPYNIRLKKLFKVTVILVLFALGYSLLYLKTGLALPCVFNKITGLNCPGCGTTRMAVSILCGNFYTAFGYNRLMFILIPLFAFYFVKACIKYVKYGKITFSKKDNIVFIIIIILLVLFGIFRNFDVFISHV